MDTNNIDFGNGLDWVSKGATPPVSDTPAEETKVEATPVAEDKPAVVEQPAEKVEAKPPEVPADEPLAIPIVDELGGEDGARQLIPLVRAIQESVDATPDEVGKKLDAALQKVLTPDQYSQFSFNLYDKFGNFFFEQYLQDHPDTLQKMGFVKADQVAKEEPDDDLLDEPADEPSPREKALQAQLAQIQTQLQALQTKDQTTEAEKVARSEAQVLEDAKKVMLGSVVDRVFEPMDWPVEDVQKAVRLAITNFQQDQEAVKNFQQGVTYQKTQQAILKASQVKAQKSFESYLGEAIEFVDTKRSKAAAATPTPIPPGRKEISTTTPSPTNSQQQPAATETNGKGPFDTNMLMNAVMERLRSQGASARQ